VANSICPPLMQHVVTHNGLVDFKGLFLVPCFAGIFAMLLLLIAFHPPKEVEASAGPGSAPH
jgi:hypothetical protein